MVDYAAYQACFESSTIASMNTCLNGDTQGPVHIDVGGNWNDPEQELAIQLGEIISITAAAASSSVQKIPPATIVYSNASVYGIISQIFTIYVLIPHNIAIRGRVLKPHPYTRPVTTCTRKPPNSSSLPA